MKSKNVLVLIVDDDISILQMIQQMLELEGFNVITAVSGETAFQVLDHHNPNIILLDIMLPDLDGLTICKRIREFSKIPIILVTGKVETNDKIDGLNAGADDYITKPFSYGELIARIDAVLRRNTVSDYRNERPVFHCRELTIDFIRQSVLVNGENIDVSATEYKILSYLASRAGRTISANELLKNIWGIEYIEANHILQVNISRLRRKINDNARNYKYIETKPGLGYILNSEE
jgi:DNA-binding response OmpR family regulator